MGAEHILSGPDHLLFLLALLALAKGFWPIVRIVTGFTIAHSITLSLAALGVVDMPGSHRRAADRRHHHLGRAREPAGAVRRRAGAG